MKPICEAVKGCLDLVPELFGKSLASISEIIRNDVSELVTASPRLPTQPVCDALCKRATGGREAKDLTVQLVRALFFVLFFGGSLFPSGGFVDF